MDILASPGASLSWWPFGNLLEASWAPLGAAWAPLGVLLGRSWELEGASGALLGPSWRTSVKTEGVFQLAPPLSGAPT
eukprot:2425748-Pyramimonas_sp.AAC.1